MTVADFEDMKFTPELRLRRLEKLMEGLVEQTANPNIGTVSFPHRSSQNITIGNISQPLTPNIIELDSNSDKTHQLKIKYYPEEIKLIQDEINLIRNQQFYLTSHVHQIENSRILDKESFNRTLKCSIYLSDGNLDAANKVEAAIEILIEAIGFDVLIRNTPRHGSWYRDFFVRSKEMLSNQEVQKRLKKAERAAELQLYGRTQSDIDLKTAEAVAKLKSSIKDEDSAVILIGNLFIAKYKQGNGHSSITLTLSAAQLEAFENHPDPFTDPERLVDYLQKLNRKPVDMGIDILKDALVQAIDKPLKTKRRSKSDAIKAELEGNIPSQDSLRQLPPPSTK